MNATHPTLEEINNIASSGNRETTEYLLNILQTTSDNCIRNAVAIVLSDWEEELAVPILIALIESEETEESRGTLLYALTAFDCTPYLSKIAKQLCYGGYEVIEMATQIFENLPESLDKKVAEESLQILQMCLQYSEQSEHRNEYIEHVIKILNDSIDGRIS